MPVPPASADASVSWTWCAFQRSRRLLSHTPYLEERIIRSDTANPDGVCGNYIRASVAPTRVLAGRRTHPLRVVREHA
jgi:hypothetical protein